METIDAIEESLYQTRNESRQDPLNYPIRLNNKLTSLMRLVAIGDSRPTTQALEVQAELRQQIEQQLSMLDPVWNTRVPQLNERIRQLDIDLLAIARE